MSRPAEPHAVPLAAEKDPARAGKGGKDPARERESHAVGTVGFVGLGNIGLPMATALARRYRVVVHDVRSHAAQALPSAMFVSSPAQVARAADVIGVAVYNEAQLDDVVLGPDGLLAGARPGHVILVHSTVRPETVRSLAAAARGAGVTLLDVAVAGGNVKAATGQLTLMAGGAQADLDRVRPVLEALGEHIFHVGPVGAGMAAKLANNLVLHVGYAVLGEALRIGGQAGIDEAALLEVMSAGTARSWLTENYPYYHHQVRHVLPHDLVSKDLVAAIPPDDTETDMPLTWLAARLAAQRGIQPAAQRTLQRQTEPSAHDDETRWQR